MALASASEELYSFYPAQNDDSEQSVTAPS